MTEPAKRLVCVVEGKGDVKAIPNLCARIMIELSVWDWFVDPTPIRRDRSHLVDGRVASPLRPVRAETFDGAIQLARRDRRADGVVVVCDSDDDCPAVWGPSASQRMVSVCPGAAVMVQREYETWILHGLERAASLDPGLVERRRDAKGLLRRYHVGYRPNLHQLELTRRIDIQRCWARSDSFDKLVRSIAEITASSVPPRPRP